MAHFSLGDFMADYVYKRGKRYSYIRRVPEELWDIEGKKTIRIALKTSDYEEAKQKALIYNARLKKYWDELLSKSGSISDKERDYRKAVATAKRYGFIYKNIDEMLDASVDELVERIDAAQGKSKEVSKSLMGLTEKPKLMLSECLEPYWPLCTDRTQGFDDLKMRKWQNPRKRAVNRFIEVIGDKPIDEVTKGDVITFKEQWLELIAGGKSPDSANREISSIKDVLLLLGRHLELDIPVAAMFDGMRLKKSTKQRPPFPISHVQDVIFEPGALDGLNDQARAILYILADTGARLNEIVGLEPADIFLDAPQPYIWIRPNKKRPTLKTIDSQRKIPLVGSALVGAKMFPDGFDRYQNSEAVSATLSKYLKKHKMFPTTEHKVYSLRHTFYDKLVKSKAPDTMKQALMGHLKKGPRYGSPYSVKDMAEFMSKTAFQIDLPKP